MSGSELSRYDLVERLATGGMGEVFLGRAHGEHGFHKMVAVKRIRPELASSAEFVVRFVAEAKLAVQLSHANVVQVFDLGRVGDDLLLVMEYVHGADLGQLLGALGGEPMPTAIALYAAMEALKGLCCAHDAGVIHCDISPSNLLWSYAGEVKIADFGVAQALDLARRKQKGGGNVAGKLRYMAPEQLRGEALDARADLYALAVLLYEALMGRRLFEDEARDVELPPIDHVPAALEAILRRTLARDAAERQASARVLLAELTRVAYALPPVTAPDVGTWVRGLVPPRAEPGAPDTGAARFDAAVRQLVGGRSGGGTQTALPPRGTESFVVHRASDGGTVWTRVAAPTVVSARKRPARVWWVAGLGALGALVTAQAGVLRRLPAAPAAAASAPVATGTPSAAMASQGTEVAAIAPTPAPSLGASRAPTLAATTASPGTSGVAAITPTTIPRPGSSPAPMLAATASPETSGAAALISTTVPSPASSPAPMLAATASPGTSGAAALTPTPTPSLGAGRARGLATGAMAITPTPTTIPNGAPPPAGNAIAVTPTSKRNPHEALPSGGRLTAVTPTPATLPVATRTLAGAPAPTTAAAPTTARRSRASARGFLSVYAEPWAYVFLDGKRIGPTPLMKHEVAAGEHQVRLERPGIHPRLERIKVRPGQTQLVNVDLEASARR